MAARWMPLGEYRDQDFMKGVPLYDTIKDRWETQHGTVQHSTAWRHGRGAHTASTRVW